VWVTAPVSSSVFFMPAIGSPVAALVLRAERAAARLRRRR
jgi:hypothetical protein